MKITITGPPGSGKSSVAKFIAKKLGLKHYSAGDIRREIAAKKGMTLEEFNRWDEKTHEGDKAADEFLKNIGKKEDNFVVDGRLPAYFIPDSIKIFLYVDPKVGAKRVMERRKGVEVYKNLKEAMKKLAEREESDNKRYQELYGINYADKRNFDLCIDTSKTTVEEVADEIIEFVKTKQKTNPNLFK